jgi:hypothetical protein
MQMVPPISARTSAVFSCGVMIPTFDLIAIPQLKHVGWASRAGEISGAASDTSVAKWRSFRNRNVSNRLRHRRSDTWPVPQLEAEVNDGRNRRKEQQHERHGA